MTETNKWLRPARVGDPLHPAAFSPSLIVERARVFAYAAHAAMGQKRKYTDEDYIIHPMEVGEDIFRLTMIEGPDGEPLANEDQVIAAILHDTIEDTRRFVDEHGNQPKDVYKAIRSGVKIIMVPGITGELIGSQFGSNVQRITEGLTEVAMPWDGNRSERVRINREHTAAQANDVKTVKLADVKHNIKNIGMHDPGYAVGYIKEKRDLMPALEGGAPILFDEVWTIINDFLR